MREGGNREIAAFRDCHWTAAIVGAPRSLGRGYAENDEPQPHVLFTLGLPNLKPEPWRPST